MTRWAIPTCQATGFLNAGSAIASGPQGAPTQNSRHPATLSQQKQEVQTEKPLEHSQHPHKTKEREQNSKTGEMKGESYLNHVQNSD